MKRWRARARGRVNRIRKRTCHITVELVQLEAPARPRGAQAAKPETTEETDTPAEAKPKRVAPQEEDRGGGGLMGQKVHPGGLRVGVIHDWKSNWYTGKKEFAGLHPRGRQDPRPHHGQARARGAVGHPDPQGQAADHGRHLHRAAGHRDRQVGRRGRRAAQRAARAHPEERPHQHQRDQAARAGREARRAVDRRAAPEPRQLPPRDEALARLGDAVGRPGDQDHLRRPPRRRRDGPLARSTRRAASRCTRFARTSTTASPRRRRPTAGSASRSGSTRARSCPRATRGSRRARTPASATRIRRAASGADRPKGSAPPARVGAAAARTARVSARCSAGVVRAARPARRRPRRPGGSGPPAAGRRRGRRRPRTDEQAPPVQPVARGGASSAPPPVARPEAADAAAGERRPRRDAAGTAAERDGAADADRGAWSRLNGRRRRRARSQKA